MQTQCPNCQKTLNVPDILDGKEGECPKCKTTFFMQKLENISSIEAKNENALADVNTASDLAIKISERACPFCDRHFSKNSRVCPHCNTVIEEASNAPLTQELEEQEYEVHEPMKECEYCGEKILEKARKCKHCGEMLIEEGNRPLPPLSTGPNQYSKHNEYGFPPVVYINANPSDHRDARRENSGQYSGEELSSGWVVCGWFMAFLLPIVGFIIGIICCVKGRTGNGVGMIIVSVLMTVGYGSIYYEQYYISGY